VSRRHNAKAQGEARVQLVCDECGYEEWVLVTFRDEEDPCLVDIAIHNTGEDSWRYEDDLVVCSQACAEVFYG